MKIMSSLGYRNLILTPSYGPVSRKVWIVRDKPTVNYKQRVSFNTVSYLRLSIQEERHSFHIIIRWKFPKPEERELITY